MLIYAACIIALLPVTLAQVTCIGLGDFNPDPPFDNWPDPTCPGNPTLELVFTMYEPDRILGDTFDRFTVPSFFDPSRQTVFLAHGWLGDTDSGWMDQMKDDLTGAENVNVVTVGWGGSGGAENLNYFESASTTRTVGAELAEVVLNLISSGGGSASRMHCSGHSLGSHVCGHFGRWAAGNGQRPARITGMDPAGPNFAANPDRTVGLHTDCADFVDTVNTDRSLGSTPEPGGTEIALGHQNFFPNGGNEQPGCATDTCSHNRVVDLYRATISTSCTASMECTASNDLPGSCSITGNFPEMGYYATSGLTGLFYLTTGASFPYC